MCGERDEKSCLPAYRLCSVPSNPAAVLVPSPITPGLLTWKSSNWKVRSAAGKGERGRKERFLCLASDWRFGRCWPRGTASVRRHIPPTWALGPPCPSGPNYLSQTEACLLVGGGPPLQFPIHFFLPRFVFLSITQILNKFVGKSSFNNQPQTSSDDNKISSLRKSAFTPKTHKEGPSLLAMNMSFYFWGALSRDTSAQTSRKSRLLSLNRWKGTGCLVFFL